MDWDDVREYSKREKKRTYTPPPGQEPPPAANEPWVTLHLQPTAPPELVRAAFKTLAQLHHPDKPGGDTSKMQAVNNAYLTLTAQKRAA